MGNHLKRLGVLVALGLLSVSLPLQVNAEMKTFDGSFVSFQYPDSWKLSADDGPDMGIKSVSLHFKRYDECGKEESSLLDFQMISSVGPKEEYTIEYLQDSPSGILPELDPRTENHITQLGQIDGGVGLDTTGYIKADDVTLALRTIQFLKLIKVESPTTQRYFSANGFIAGSCGPNPALTPTEQQEVTTFLNSIRYHSAVNKAPVKKAL